MKKFFKYFFLIIWTLWCFLGITKYHANYKFTSWIIVILFTLMPYFIIWFINHKSKKNRTLIVESVPATESSNVIYCTDDKCIADEEVSYLIENGQSIAMANWKVPNLIRQITESYQIICKTNNPEILCSRYNFIVEKINELTVFEQQGLLDKNTFNQYKALITDDNHYKLILSCYNKYKTKAHSELKTQNGINKRINKFWEVIRNNVSDDLYNKAVTLK